MTLAVTPAIIVLLGLSVWQVQRLQWKEALLSEIDARMTSSPVALTSEFRELPNYQAVVATGRFLKDQNLYVIGQSHEGRSGVRVFTPFETNLGQLIWIDRGWSPDKEHSLNAVTITGDITIEAVLKKYQEQQGAFKGGNDPASELWFIVNPEEMSAHRGLKALKSHYLQLAKPTSESAVPFVLPPTTNIRNSHFQYALIWLSLAISLLTIYLILSLQRPSNLDGTKG